ncbi:MAG TPA: FxLYD domain-containing protein [Bryobacteraceae bacterium]|nr:FxLYD domain-containing protein [Bryobacteraceae bacterium]
MAASNPWLARLEKKLAHLRARIERFISGSAPEDPLYLTNRTWKQKLKLGAAAAVPVLILIGLVMIGTTDVFRLQKVDPYERPGAEKRASAAPVPHLPDPTLGPANLEVENIRIVRDLHSPAVSGVVRNNTGRKIASAEVSYYLTDKAGSLLGTESVEVANIASHGSVTFHLPLKELNAEFVLVREVHAN